jgi:shikimate kinase
MTPDKSRVYIIGFMGSGKTTAGKKLASLLGWSFTDLDKEIENHCGKSIPEIFSQNGEDYFRKVESDVLKNLKDEISTVVSTGGGTPCNAGNMDYMLETGLTLYLKLTPGQLTSRLIEATEDRPLIKGLKKPDLQRFVEDKLSVREKWYNRSEITLDGFDLDLGKVKSIILSYTKT